jgi:hypothetical protein
MIHLWSYRGHVDDIRYWATANVELASQVKLKLITFITPNPSYKKFPMKYEFYEDYSFHLKVFITVKSYLKKNKVNKCYVRTV